MTDIKPDMAELRRYISHVSDCSHADVQRIQEALNYYVSWAHVFDMIRNADRDSIHYLYEACVERMREVDV